MALKTTRSAFGQMLQFLLRFLGLNGLVTMAVGGFLWYGLDFELAGPIVVAAGAVAVGLAILGELRGLAGMAFSHRGGAGVNVVLQIALASVLVVGGNVFAFLHHQRFDCTHDRSFTLPKNIREQLLKLQGDTDIIVLQQYVSFGQSAENKQDKYDFAAQRRIVEKVKDLAEQFQDLGPRFRVRVLDIQDDGYEKKLKEIEGISKELAEAVEKAPENSIFFFSREQKNIQRLSFSDIYELDKQGSIDGKNLVLNYQGVGPFASKIFNIEEKKPRVALAVIHPILGFNNQMEPRYTMSGARKLLNTYGFETTDLVLRKIGEDGDLSEEPTALTYDESRFEQIEDELAETEESIKKLEKEIGEVEGLYKFWSDSTLAGLNKKYVYFYLEDGRQGVTLRSQIDSLKKSGIGHKLVDVDEEDRKNRTTVYKQNLEVMKHVLESDREERANLTKEKATLKVENLAEKRRLADVETKTKSMLANVDLLILPRPTLMNAPAGEAVPNRVHRLDPAQLNALKAFLKEGKPILFLLGPANDQREFPERGPSDQLEGMLAELGFKLPRQTILYNIEGKEYNERKLGGAFTRKSRDVEVPGVKFDDTTLTVHFSKSAVPFAPHPIRTSLKMMKQTIGSKKAQEVRIRHPRPVYFVHTTLTPEYAGRLVGSLALPGWPGPMQASTVWVRNAQQQPDEDAVFLVTREESWNEEKPFITKDAEGIRIPRFTPPKDDDPKKGGLEEARRGPFPIGVAVETQAPEWWFDSYGSKPSKVRVAVIGSGGAFIGPTLPPLKEKMLLDVSNWLLGRDNLLAKADEKPWQYPRVEVGPVERILWIMGVCIALPFLFVYIGVNVWLVRRMR